MLQFVRIQNLVHELAIKGDPGKEGQIRFKLFEVEKALLHYVSLPDQEGLIHFQKVHEELVTLFNQKSQLPISIQESLNSGDGTYRP